MNRHTSLQDFVTHARHGDTHTTVREDMGRAETYTATSDSPVRDNRRKVTLTTTVMVANMYETKETTGTLVLDTASIPGEVLDGVIGGSPSILARATALTRPFRIEDLLVAHLPELPAA